MILAGLSSVLHIFKLKETGKVSLQLHSIEE